MHDRVPNPSADGAGTTWTGAFVFTVLAQVVQGVVRLACLVIVGRYAGKTTLGEVSAVLAIATFLALAWPQPAGAVASRYVSLAAGDAPRQRMLASFTFRTVIVAAPLIAFLAAGASAMWLRAEPPLVLWAALLPVCLGLSTYVRGLRAGRMQFRQGLIWDSVGAVVTLGVLVLVLTSGSFELVLVGFCVGYLVSAVPGTPGRSPGLPVRERREVIRYTAWMAVQVIAAGGLLHATVAIAALQASRSQLGDLGAAVSIATPILLLSIALRTSTVPFVARRLARGDVAGLRQATDTLMRFMVVLFIPAFGLACIWSEQLLQVIYGPKFTSGANLLVILLLGVSLNSFNASHVWLMTGPTWGARALAISNATGLVVGAVVATTASASPTTSAAVGYLVGSFVSASATTAIVWRSAPLAWSGVLARLITGYVLIAGSVGLTQSMHAKERLTVSMLFIAVYMAVNSADLRKLARSQPWRLSQDL